MHLAAAQSLVAELGGLSGMAKDARVTDFDKYHLTTYVTPLSNDL